MAGRTTKLTDEVEARILDAVRGGNFLGTSAAYAGIHEATLFRWLADERPRYRAFREAVDRARAEAEVRSTASMQKLILGGEVKKEITRTTTHPDGSVTREVEREVTLPDMKAIGFYLERSFPDRWGRRQALEVTGAGGGPVQVGLQVDVTGIAARVAAARAELAEEHASLPPPPAPLRPDEEIVDAEIVEEPGASQ
jgi:hypothetical protein